MKKLSKIMGLLVVLTMLVGLLPMASASPAAAIVGTMTFGAVTAPSGDTGSIMTTSEITDFARASNGMTLLADVGRSRIYRSTLGPAGWLNYTAYFPTAGNLPMWKVAVAPDDTNLFAGVFGPAAAPRSMVYITTDAGVTWTNTTFPAMATATEAISAIAISGKYPVAGGDGRDLVVVTTDTAAATWGRVMVLQLRALGVAGWTDITAGTGGTGVSLAGAWDFFDVKLAPAYAGDFTVVLVGANANGLRMHIGFRDINLNTVVWDTPANWAAGVLISAAATHLTTVSAKVQLPADYAGQVDRMRRAYVGFDDNSTTTVAAGGVVYRVDNYRAYSLAMPEARVYDIAYSGSFNAGKLLVTGVLTGTAVGGTVPVWRSLNPQSAAATWDLPYKPPTGGFAAGAAKEIRSVVAWSADGKTAVLGSGTSAVLITTPALWGAPASWMATTANDETAFSVSADDSDSWNQTGYIDTTLSSFTSIDVAPDETKMYLATCNTVVAGNMDSIWKATSTTGAAGLGGGWVRVLAFVSNSNLPLVKVAKDKADGSVVFWADMVPLATNTTIQRSTDAGQMWTNTMPGFSLQDFVVVDQNSLVVFRSDGQFRTGTSTGPGWIWSAQTDPRMTAIYCASNIGKNIVVGAALGGWNTYSTDGFATWSRILYIFPAAPGAFVFGTGAGVRATMDADFANSKALFFTSDNANSSVYRWVVGKNTNEYTDIGATAGAHTGIASPAKGVVYASINNAVDRTIDSTDEHPKPGVEWDFFTAGLPNTVTINTVPNAIIANKGKDRCTVWGIDTSPATDAIYAMMDLLTEATPAFVSPKVAAGKDFADIPVAFDGYAAPFGVHWSVPVPQALTYRYQLSTAEDFADLVNNVNAAPANTSDPSQFMATGAAGAWPMMGGQTYWARVRVTGLEGGQAMRSLWSKPLKMVVKSGVPIHAPYSAPQPQTPAIGKELTMPASVGFTWTPLPNVTEYSFVLATDANLVKTLVSTTVTGTSYSYDTALKEGVYFWAVQPTKPVPGEKSPVASFTVVPKPAPPAAPVVNVPAPVVNVQPPPPMVATPVWVWVVIAIGAVLVIVTIVLIFRTRKV